MVTPVVLGSLDVPCLRALVAAAQQDHDGIPLATELHPVARPERDAKLLHALPHGFVRVHCDGCGLDRVVAFSCKGRGFCPSCVGRRMADTAAHLVDRVLPEVPVREWVLLLPFALRYRLAYDARKPALLRHYTYRELKGRPYPTRDLAFFVSGLRSDSPGQALRIESRRQRSWHRRRGGCRRAIPPLHPPSS